MCTIQAGKLKIRGEYLYASATILVFFSIVIVTMEEDTLENIIKKLQRDVNSLSDDNRSVRKRALSKLCKEVGGHKDNLQVLTGLLRFLLKPVLKMLSDPVENCRAVSIEFFMENLPLLDEIKDFLPYIIPVAVARLGTQEITEPSEEIRLSLVTFLTSIVFRSGANIAPYVNDLIIILQRTIIDPYPQVKKESCTCTIKLAEACPASFHQQSESLAKPLFTSMTHQHSKVRVACIKALGIAIRYGSPKPLDDALPMLAQRACDNTPSVRSCLADVVGHWLLELPDRYSYHPKLVPLLFTCMGDELSEIRSQSHELWKQVGEKYLLENEEELKDRIDFMQQVTPATFLEFPRPGLGCRILVYRCFSKILPAILRDLSDWTTHSRIKSTQLLFTLLYHLEDRATHHIRDILNGLYKACQDEESAVIDQAVMCSRAIGYYVPPEVWCKLILPAVRTSAGCYVTGSDQASTVAVGPVQCTSCLKVLVGLLHGSTPSGVQPQLGSIVDCIYEKEVGESEYQPLLEEILDAILFIIDRASDNCRKYSLKLFTVVLRLYSSKYSQYLSVMVNKCWTSLARAQNLEGISSLFAIHSKDILQSFKENYENWNVHSSDCYMFGSLLSGCGPVIGLLLDDVIPILSYCLNTEREPEIRLHFITLLIRLLLELSSTLDSQNTFSKFASSAVLEILLPNLIWKAGRTAAAIRTAAMTGLQALMQNKELASGVINELGSEILPQVVSCLDDDNESTRLVSCKVLGALLSYKTFDVDKLNGLYGDLLKRLDDSSDEIRVEVTRTLTLYIEAFPVNYDKPLYRAHTEALFKGLLIHLDDSSPNIQEAVFEVLRRSVRLDSDTLKEQVEVVKCKHREAKWCDQLLQLIDSHSSSEPMT